MFTKYGTLGNAELLRRCDGKQVLARVCAHFGSKVGVTKKGFQDAIYHAAITSKNSEVANISQVLMSRLS